MAFLGCGGFGGGRVKSGIMIEQGKGRGLNLENKG